MNETQREDIKYNPQNPCNDKLLSQLSQKDSLTGDEMKIYLELRRICIEDKNSRELTAQTARIADANWLMSMVYVSTIIGVLIWAAIEGGK